LKPSNTSRRCSCCSVMSAAQPSVTAPSSRTSDAAPLGVMCVSE
jgi:hypothetical protein